MSRRALRIALVALFIEAPAAGFAFEGKYLVGDEGYHQFLDIRKAPDGGYDVAFELSNRGCEGGLEGRGRVESGALRIRPKSPDASDACVVTAKRRGDALAVKESRCSAWHGAACDFDGLYEPRGK
jgi:hypothetical protein